jgi:hypothetical protein
MTTGDGTLLHTNMKQCEREMESACKHRRVELVQLKTYYMYKIEFFGLGVLIKNTKFSFI